MSQAAKTQLREGEKLPLPPRHQDLRGWRLETLWKLQRETEGSSLDGSKASSTQSIPTQHTGPCPCSSILPAGTNAKSGLHLTEPDKSNNHRLVGKLLAFQQRLINSDSIKSLLINYAERYYCRLEHGIIIGLTTVYKNEM